VVVDGENPNLKGIVAQWLLSLCVDLHKWRHRDISNRVSKSPRSSLISHPIGEADHNSGRRDFTIVAGWVSIRVSACNQLPTQ
jgi:hypothetical protein